jgi:hypothetical protein
VRQDSLALAFWSKWDPKSKQAAKKIPRGVSGGREPSQHLRDAQDGDVAVAAKREQIVIARDDDFGLCLERTRDDVIVVGIAHDGRRLSGGTHELREREIVAEQLVDGTAGVGARSIARHPSVAEGSIAGP